MMCYNCRQVANHIAADCPMHRLFTRCPSCNVVAKNVDAHKVWCTTKTFLSEYCGDNSTVFEVKDMMRLVFNDIDEKIFVVDNRREIEIGSNPLWLAAIDCFVTKSTNRILSLSTARPRKSVITIVDKDNKPIVSICFDDSVLIVNGRYKLEKNGTITTNWHATNEITEPHMCRIKVLNKGSVLKLRLYIWEMNYKFVVYPTGPIFIDPQYSAAEKSLATKNMNVTENPLDDKLAKNDEIDIDATTTN